MNTAKLSGLSGGTLAASPQQFANLIDRLGHVIVRSGLDADPMLLQFRMQLAERGQRKIRRCCRPDSCRRRTPLFTGCSHPNHREQLALNIDFLPQRALVAKQFLGSIRASMITVDRCSSSISLNQRPDAYRRSNTSFAERLYRPRESCSWLCGRCTSRRNVPTPNSGRKYRMPAVTAFTCGRSLHRFGIVESEFLARAHFLGRPPEGERLRWKAKMMFEPMLLIDLRTLLVQARVTTDEMPITTATPITMPSTVSAERSLLLRIVSRRHVNDFAVIRLCAS